MPDFGRKLHLGRLERVLLAYQYVDLEDAALIGRALRPLNRANQMSPSRFTRYGCIVRRGFRYDAGRLVLRNGHEGSNLEGGESWRGEKRERKSTFHPPF